MSDQDPFDSAAERTRSEKTVENKYGKSVREKATPALMQMLAASAQRAGRETLGMRGASASSSGAPMRTVIEFDRASMPASGAYGAVQRELTTTKLDELMKVIGGLIPGLGSSREAQLRVISALRGAAITVRREAAYKQTNGVRNHLEKIIGTLYAQRPDALVGSGNASALTQTCWLNSTIRATTPAEALADVASDNTITSIDRTRAIKADISVTRATVGADAYSKGVKNPYNPALTGKGVIVAVIDSEVALSHPALVGRVVQKRNYTVEPWGNADSHGTAVAGIIAAADAAHMGLASEAMIYNYKVLATTDSLNTDDFGGAIAIQDALEDGVHVANCSWGAGPASDGTSREARACDEAWALGMAIVKSAGNQGDGPSTLTSPADAEGVIVVGATDVSGKDVQYYSSRGPLTVPRDRPHLVAPGGSVDAERIAGCLSTGGFGELGVGTSFAAPHVSGLIAMLLQGQPHLSPDEVLACLVDNAIAIPNAPAHSAGAGLAWLGKYELP